ncbi:glycosyl transferase group 1 [Richelia sinica FACHB-800]|uniref:Glycosyl transferase group 1 n=1 Tax=Richelia sinica FACHB-800 TaxID=1357546 RepID=A0A975T6U8_9NOST|nr:glycosyltransferase family 4 protein [Richelia sinica]MBD2666130.1 glycosyltransferase family 4 protein [Richelia sinica FACHB-800]QXE23124.1 glycosyl transferase group 1 [Richelia sinica FACHB-800]
MKKKLKVYLACTGVGIINRGIETFARECFDGLHGTEGLQIELFKGAGEEKTDEQRLWNVPRNGKIAQLLGKLIKRNGYVVEQLSSFLPFVYQIKKGKPDIIFYSDSNLGFQLYWWRKQIGVPYRLIFSNGGPCHPPFSRTDYVQQVAPFYLEQALKAGESPSKHFLVPYGINVPQGNPLLNQNERQNLKQRLGLPIDRPIIISVGWISATHKRMDYVVDEVAALPEPRPYLVMLGHINEDSQTIINQATLRLGKEGFTALSVPYEQVSQYYQVSDIFVLGSLQEGFGRVYLEALIHGLPCIVHDHPVMRYVLGSEGTFADLSKPSAMTQAIAQILQQPQSPQAIIHRREYVRKRFSWKNLIPAYMDMFHSCL